MGRMLVLNSLDCQNHGFNKIILGLIFSLDIKLTDSRNRDGRLNV